MNDDDEVERLEKRMRGETGRTVVQNRITQMMGQYIQTRRAEVVEEDRARRAAQAAKAGEALAPALETSQDDVDDVLGEDAGRSTLEDLLGRDADPG
jgi:hypothetical protein